MNPGRNSFDAFNKTKAWILVIRTWWNSVKPTHCIFQKEREKKKKKKPSTNALLGEEPAPTSAKGQGNEECSCSPPNRTQPRQPTRAPVPVLPKRGKRARAACGGAAEDGTPAGARREGRVVGAGA